MSNSDQAFLKHALETARHDLVTTHGLWATDRTELFDTEKFQLLYDTTIKRMDEAIATMEQREGDSECSRLYRDNLRLRAALNRIVDGIDPEALAYSASLTAAWYRRVARAALAGEAVPE